MIYDLVDVGICKNVQTSVRLIGEGGGGSDSPDPPPGSATGKYRSIAFPARTVVESIEEQVRKISEISSDVSCFEKQLALFVYQYGFKMARGYFWERSCSFLNQILGM